MKLPRLLSVLVLLVVVSGFCFPFPGCRCYENNHETRGPEIPAAVEAEPV